MAYEFSRPARLFHDLLRWSGTRNYAHAIVSKIPKVAPYEVRVFGDPVLKTPCRKVDEITDVTRSLAKDMLSTMYLAPGVGLAANQVGVSLRMFVYDDSEGKGARVIINPEIVETSGTFTYEEGCLSVPGQFFEIVRPDHVLLRGTDLNGNPIELETSGFEGRILQHEVDHLDGKLLLSRLTPEQKKQAMASLRAQEAGG